MPIPRTVARHARAAALVAVTWCVVVGPSQAQITLPGGAGDGYAPVERDAVAERALHSFDEFAAREIAASPADDGAAEEAAAGTQAAFEAALERRLDELGEDGLLEAGEVGDALTELRERFADELRTVLTAIEEGHPPPPLAREFDDRAEAAWALTRYTAIVRNTWLQWLQVLGAVLAGVVLAQVSIRSAERISDALAKRENSALARLARAASGPLHLTLVAVAARLGLEQVWLPRGLAGPLGQGLALALFAALFWFLFNLCSPTAAIATGALRRSYGKRFDVHVEQVVDRLLRMLVLTGLVVAIVQLVLDTSLTNLFASLGLLGIALYFVLRGSLENVAASFTILGDEPFRAGDLVVLDAGWGTVERIGFRSTRVRLLEGHLLTVPNTRIIDEVAHNVSARPSIRRRFRLGLEYTAPPEDVERALEILREIVDHDHQPEDEPSRVELEAFGASTLRVFVQYHYQPPDFYEALAFDTKVNLEILRRFEEAGIAIAFPTEVRVLKGDGLDGMVGDDSDREDPEDPEGLDDDADEA